MRCWRSWHRTGIIIVIILPVRPMPMPTLKSLLIHHEVILPITKQRLDLGLWQQVYYAEFDGKRRKRVVIKVIRE